MYFSIEFSKLVKDYLSKAHEFYYIDFEELDGEDEEGIRSVYYWHSEKLKGASLEFLEMLNVQAKKDIRGHNLKEKLSYCLNVTLRR